MKTITKSELTDLLKTIRGTTFLSIESQTKPKLKSGNPFPHLVKISHVNGCAGFNYENSVNRQSVKEDGNADFEAKPRKWGKRIPKTPLVEHNGKFYLELKVENSNSEYFDYSSNNKRINPESVKDWQYKKSSRQGVKNEVIVRDYSLDNIQRIKLNKKEYIVI